MVSFIFLLALNFNNIKTTRAFFADFSRLVSAEEKLEKLKKLNNSSNIEENLKEELHWI